MNFEDRYGPLDRMLHRIALRAGTAQHALSDVEEFLYGDTIHGVPLEDPVFITALPRSGTTILLRLLVNTGRFASHTYRDMPFVLCPILWRRFHRGFTVDREARERAHGDGLKISGESPEAFEEMVWKRFWPGHYQDDRISHWAPADRNQEFETFFETHMKKVIALRRDDPSDARRYVSKNNLNISRLAALPRPLRRGTLVVPFRDPVQQAASMLRQHERFLKIHDEDGFVQRYMEGIGHYEFGRGLRPVDFDGWLEAAPSPDRLEFWIRYWIAAYGFILEHRASNTHLVSYASLTTNPERALAQLAEIVDVASPELVRQVADLRSPRTHEVNMAGVPGEVLDEAYGIHRELDHRAVP